MGFLTGIHIEADGQNLEQAIEPGAAASPSDVGTF
jgi:hypothetical protein